MSKRPRVQASLRYPCVALTKSPLYCCAGVDGIRQVSGRDKAARLDEVQGHQLLLAVDNGLDQGIALALPCCRYLRHMVERREVYFHGGRSGSNSPLFLFQHIHVFDSGVEKIPEGKDLFRLAFVFPSNPHSLPRPPSSLQFLRKSAEYETLPKDASSEDRRKSVVAMSEAAASLLDVAQDPVDAMSEYLLEALEEIPPKQIERRQTMNPKLSATRSRSYRIIYDF